MSTDTTIPAPSPRRDDDTQPGRALFWIHGLTMPPIDRNEAQEMLGDKAAQAINNEMRQEGN